jgi:HSP20 family molecular chaperone IbpA
MARGRLVRTVDSLIDEINAMHSAITDRAYERFCTGGWAEGRALDDWLAAERETTWRPPVELGEHDGEYVLKAAVAGVDPKQLEVCVSADDVLIRGKNEHRHDERGQVVHLCEFDPGRLFRSVHFPQPVDPDRTQANLKNGLLIITAPKAQRSKTIRVRET